MNVMPLEIMMIARGKANCAEVSLNRKYSQKKKKKETLFLILWENSLLANERW